MPGLQGPRVNLTYRWVTQHAASCPPAGVVGCVLPSCVQASAEPGSRGLREGENKWTFFGVWSSLCRSTCFSSWLALGFTLGGGFVTVVGVLPGGALPLTGSGRLGRGTALATVTAPPISHESVFLFPLWFLFGRKNYALFSEMWFCIVGYCWIC